MRAFLCPLLLSLVVVKAAVKPSAASAWLVPATQRVMPSLAPKDQPRAPTDQPRALSISMVRNEAESFQIAVRSPVKSSFKLSIDTGGVRFLDVQWFQVLRLCADETICAW